MNEKIRTAFSSSTFNENFPEASVEVPTDVPLTMMLTPGKPEPVSSVTVPVTVIAGIWLALKNEIDCGSSDEKFIAELAIVGYITGTFNKEALCNPPVLSSAFFREIT